MDKIFDNISIEHTIENYENILEIVHENLNENILCYLSSKCSNITPDDLKKEFMESLIYFLVDLTNGGIKVDSIDEKQNFITIIFPIVRKYDVEKNKQHILDIYINWLKIVCKKYGIK